MKVYPSYQVIVFINPNDEPETAGQVNNHIKSLRFKDLTPDDLYELMPLLEQDVINDFMDLRLRRHMCQELHELGFNEWIYVDDLRYNTARSFQPYDPDDDQEIKDRRSGTFDQAFDHVLNDLKIMGVISYDGQKVKPTDVGGTLFDVLFTFS